MIELTINDLAKYYGANKIFEKICFDVKTGERIGLIGPNGCGKSTLLKMIVGLEEKKFGTISKRKGQTISYLNQIPKYNGELLVKEVIMLAYKELTAMKSQISNYEGLFETLEGEELDKTVKKYGELCETFELAGGYDIETNLSKIVQGLKISQGMMEKNYEKLSGGEKTRIELAKILLEKPDILLLDEPSNHLDMTSIDWLEEYLKTYKGTVIIVSHDRYFLDRVVTKIYEMQSNRMNEYRGNYSYYVVEKERRFLLDLKYYQNQQKKIKRMEEQIKRYRVWGTMRDNEDMFKRAKELEKRLEKIEKLDRPVFENKKVTFKISMDKRSGKRVISATEISKAFNDKLLFEKSSFEVLFKESVALIGDNGSGKSTLFKAIVRLNSECQDYAESMDDHDETDNVFLDEGIIKIGSNVKLGYLPQEIAFKNNDQSILEYFQDLHNITNGQARGELAKVLFVKDDVNKKISALSGGEKSRLKLCSLLHQGVNVLLLDEPTNHLDVESREMLEELLIEYEGTLFFISHDRYFITKLANKILDIKKRGINVYNGDFNYYLSEIEKERNNEIVNDDNKSSHKKEKMQKKSNSKIEKVKRPSKYKMKETNDKIIALEEKLEGVINEMNGITDDAIKLNELYVMQQEIEDELMSLYEEIERFM